MRIWSLHPKYLDSKGLVALWREALLAKKVLEGKTKGYRNHPQLYRFRESDNPLNCINLYLSVVYREAVQRNYNFNKSKINWRFKFMTLPVTRGQLEYESKHLLKKLKVRDNDRYKKYITKNDFEVHQLFQLTDGKVEDWERII